MAFDALFRVPEAMPDDEPGEVIEPGDTDSPSLTPEQISRFAEDFYARSTPAYQTFRECSDAISGFRSSRYTITPQSSGSPMANYLRQRDVCIGLVQPLYRNGVARLSTEMPSAGVVPADESAIEIQRAQASEQALRYLWRDAEMRRTLTSFAEWLLVHGTAGLLTCMDRGNVRVKAIRAEDLRCEPGCEPEDARFVGVVRRTTRDDLKRQFPNHASIIDAAPGARIMLSSSHYLSQSEVPDRIEVLEAYCSSGHWYLLAGGKVLDQGVTPGQCRPLQIVRYTRIPGEFFGLGMVEPALDAQYAYTTILNQTIRNARQMANPKVLIERSAKVDPNAFTTRTGEKVFYTGVKPDVWVPPPMPQYFSALPPQLQALIHDLTGVHTTTLGKRAVGISSGRAIEALSANDLAQFQGTQDAIEDAVRRTAKSMLLYLKAFYPAEKVIRMFNGVGRSILATLRTTDIVNDPDVFFEAGTLFSSEVKDRDQKTLDLLRLGLITPDQAKKMMSFHLDPMANVQTIADMAHAQKVLATVVNDPTVTAVEVYPTDNLKVMEEVVGGFMRSDDFDQIDAAARGRVRDLYKQIVALSAPPVEPAMPGKPGQPGAPAAPVPTGGGFPGDIDLTAPADLALSAAEAQDGQGTGETTGVAV